eukprot:6212001-Pleurochrysis_carterae.AAC.1
MAIHEKRTLGVWALGPLRFASLGVVVILKAKLLWAAKQIGEAMEGRLDFAAYRSLVGVLEHFRCANKAPRHVMHALFKPNRGQDMKTNMMYIY